MNTKRIFALVLALVSFCTIAVGQDKNAPVPAPAATPAAKPPATISKDQLPKEKITSEGRVGIIRGLNAELAFARKPFPFGRKGLTLKDGVVSPTDQELDMMIAGYGPSVKPGDRARITGIKFKDKSIIFEINGGPERKKKWYEHISVSGMGGEVTPGAQQQPNDNTNLHGSFVELAFDHYIPNLSPEQVKLLLDPILNFHAKSAAEAYLETIPPKAKEAIKNHDVLVGMNREMVTYAKGRPPQKTREKQADGTEYEEWIYGTPPQEVQFVRFNGDEVVRVESMKIDGTKLVKTEKEITLQPEQPVVAKDGGAAPADGQQPAAADAGGEPAPGKPSLKRPGEEVDQPDASTPRVPSRRSPPVGSDPNSTTPPAGPGF
jgi:hypothetical protein